MTTPRGLALDVRSLATLVGLTVIALGTLALPGRTAQAAPSNKLLGKWQAEAMEVDGKRYPVKAPMNIVFEFVRGGKFVATVSFKERTQSKEGTWSAAGNQLTMTVEGKTEKMTFSVKGTQLRMEKLVAAKKTVHYMKRLP